MTIDQRTDKEKGLWHHAVGGHDGNKVINNFDQKIYMFPESYNELRKELSTNWPTLWQAVGWPMAYASNMFVSIMNEALDLDVQLDSEKVDAICTEYLQALWKRRGSRSYYKE